MNTARLKSFAPAIRIQLLEAVGRKLDYVLSADTPDLRQLAAQVSELRKKAQKNRSALIEQVAYTWFNRLAALRFLDARDWHPFKARILTPAAAEETQPEVLKLLRTGSLPEELKRHTDLARLNQILDGHIPSANPQREIYRSLVLATCRFYHATMPFLFEELDDVTELLLPDDLLTATSIAEGFRTEISDPDCSEVEILGWLYQFYISEKKNAVMARKKAVPKEDIPAVTQLFTPHWIVRYMVENSLGRLWMQNRPNSKLRERMEYYIDDPKEQKNDDFLRIQSVEEIRLIDPACGSGHILTYSFDLLYTIYEEEGYEPSSIPGHILTKNLHGVEIDERAASLAYFALMMKAQQHYGRFLSRQLQAEPHERIGPQICCLQEIHFVEGEIKAYMDALDIGELFTEPVLRLMHQFEEVKNFGSLIQPVLDDVGYLQDAIAAKDLGGDLFLRETHRKVVRVLDQAEILGQRYHCALANPPYMGSGAMNGPLKAFAGDKFKDSKSDMFAMFIERNNRLVLPSAFNAMITMQSWMFLSSYEKLREKLLSKYFLSSMIHLGPRAFDTIGGEVVQATAFTLENRSAPTEQGVYFRLIDGRNEAGKERMYLNALMEMQTAATT